MQRIRKWFGSVNVESDKPDSSVHPSWWYQVGEDVAVVFVHGLLSNGTQCWTASTGAYWPELLKGDPETASYSLFVAQYYSGVDAGDYDVKQCARALFDSLREKGTGSKSVLDYPRIVLVCHSLGGIVTRRMLEEKSTAFKSKDVGLVLLASPSQGSNYAYWLNPLASAFGNRQVKGLIPTDAMLIDLDERFRQMLEEKRIPKLVGTEAGEHLKPAHKKWIPGIFSKIVPSSSSSRYFGSTKLIEGTNHSTIAKPTDRNHPSYRFLRTFLLEKFPVLTDRRAEPALVPVATAVSRSAAVLFDVYSRASRLFYINRMVDTDLVKNVEIGSVWLTGPSGSGKTAAVRRFLDEKGAASVEISLGQYSNAIPAAQLWGEVGAALGITTQHPSLNDLAREASGRLINIVLDEVPISVGSPTGVVGAIAGLSEELRRHSNGRCCILACSIEKPSFSGLGTKPLEHLYIMEIPHWEETQIEQLSRLIEKELPSIAIEDEERKALVQSANGAPRFVKSFFRRRLRASATESTEDSLNLTKESFVHHG